MHSVLSYKRLEEGTFHLPEASGRKSVEIECAEMALILEGIDLKEAKRRARFSPELEVRPMP